MKRGHTTCERCHHRSTANKHNNMGIVCPSGTKPHKSHYVDSRKTKINRAVPNNDYRSPISCSYSFCGGGETLTKHVINILQGKQKITRDLKDKYQIKKDSKDTIRCINGGKYRKFKLLKGGQIRLWVKINNNWEYHVDFDPKDVMK